MKIKCLTLFCVTLLTLFARKIQPWLVHVANWREWCDRSDSERYAGRRRRVYVRRRASDGSYLRQFVGSPGTTSASCDAVSTLQWPPDDWQWRGCRQQSRTVPGPPTDAVAPYGRFKPCIILQKSCETFDNWQLSLLSTHLQLES